MTHLKMAKVMTSVLLLRSRVLEKLYILLENSALLLLLLLLLLSLQASEEGSQLNNSAPKIQIGSLYT